MSLPQITTDRKAREDQIYREIGSRVRAIRLASGISQEELATRLGVDRVTLSRYESGRRTLPLATLVLAAQELRRPLTDFWPSPSGTQASPATVPSALSPSGLTELVDELTRHPELIPSVWGFLAALNDTDDGTTE
jgi:transcriptional regulator with XRE-family HTH domain